MTGTGEEPWWASGEHAGIGDEDPFEAHRTARDGAGAGTEPWFRILRQVADGHRRFDSETCGVCPVCTAIASIGDARPELLHHLSEASRHLTLAVKSFIDAHAASYGASDLQHIEVDDDPSTDES